MATRLDGSDSNNSSWAALGFGDKRADFLSALVAEQFPFNALDYTDPTHLAYIAHDGLLYRTGADE